MITVVGCADLLVPENAWYKRYNDVARIGCNNQNKTWVLTCEGNRWNGVVGSCSDSGDLSLLFVLHTV